MQEQYLIAASYAKNLIFTYDPADHCAQVYMREQNGALTQRRVEHADTPEGLLACTGVRILDDKKYAQMIRQIDSGVKKGAAQLRTKQKDGTEGWIEARFYNQFAENKKLLRTICVFTDITELKEKELGLYQAASCDALTGLYNRTYFEQRVQRALQTAGQKPFAFLMLDVDDFKQINDTRGHMFGDEVLRLVAQTLRITLRTSDVIARQGGDEFALMLSGVSSEKIARLRGEELREKILQQGRDAVGIDLHCSVGIALAPRDGEEYEKVYEHADRALYRAKQKGKRRCCVYR